MRAPHFSESFAEALKQSARNRGLCAFVPWWLLICLAVPVLAYFYWCPIKAPETDAFIGVFAAFSVVGGFLGALSISAMSQIQQTVSTYPFSDYLKSLDIFDTFLMHPQLVLAIQLLFVASNAFLVLLAVAMDLGQALWLVFYLELGLLIYTISKTWGLVDTIRTLMWHYAEYTKLLAEVGVNASASKAKKKS